MYSRTSSTALIPAEVPTPARTAHPQRRSSIATHGGHCSTYMSVGVSSGSINARFAPETPQGSRYVGHILRCCLSPSQCAAY
ncbi:hypothetical protein B0H19DRAFT_1182687 [Mycena capillaripes]|nr:hypothetical protein B0H19DRAFT_1182687 [Mycena capillaripes]